MTQQNAYFEYLQGRSWRATLYRSYFLYPRLCRHLRGRVLDIGCGLGDMVRFRPHTVGVDVNPKLVEYCRSLNLDVRHMGVDRLPFLSKEFNGAILDNVLEHLIHPQPLLQEIHRVLEPAGTLIVGVPGTHGYKCDPDHKKFYGEEELTECLATAGFSRERLLHFPIRSRILDRKLRMYCIYGVFRSTSY